MDIHTGKIVARSPCIEFLADHRVFGVPYIYE